MEVEQGRYDLAIVGGGPAGASAAITAARKGASVVLFDSSDFPRQKVCGEFVSAESLGLLRELLRGHERADDVLQSAPPISRARIFASGRVAESPIEPSGLSIPRTVLDLLLWECAQQAGVTAHSKCEALAIGGEGPFTVSAAHGEFVADAIILCTGRWSRFSDSSEVASGPKWIGVKAHYRERNPALSTDLYFFDNGYCGVQPVSRDAVNVCALVRSDSATTLEAVFRCSPQLQARAEQWQRITAPVSTAPVVYRKPVCLRGRMLLAGDAAGFIDPFAGDGISLALRSGQAAAECILRNARSLKDACQEYEAVYREQFAPLIAASTRVRRLTSLRGIARPVALQMLRIPGVLPFVIRKTRVG
ncbi:MAG: NAD(P)/FAD-dependent oxidoreductase [Candidatus Korobacteraceae bacterium]